jgi:hypothetical protein
MTSPIPSPVLSKIAFYQNRRDEVPNQELAKALAQERDADGLREIAAHLWDKNRNVQSDCLKVLYETGYLAPDLIAPFTTDFLKLLHSRNNRMVWGAMIALGCVAPLRADEIWPQVDPIIQTIQDGSVITTVWGVKVLAPVAASAPERREKIMPFLLRLLRTCIPRDVPTHAESMLCAVDDIILPEFSAILELRAAEMTASQLSRLNKVRKKSGR